MNLLARALAETRDRKVRKLKDDIVDAAIAWSRKTRAYREAVGARVPPTDRIELAHAVEKSRAHLDGLALELGDMFPDEGEAA